MAKFETLVDPNGVEWTPGTAIEENDLRTQGYRPKSAVASTDAPGADTDTTAGNGGKPNGSKS